ncbi:uncharacterized protein LOC119383242 [Rhipicephalus sanguineus]|uniref:uncharacterized protein LOC119383242 n=1 Tax=Rhipicephalus sanguineus TaxID=34632 RepID=UPI00189342E8|nr:uncharacterized protein LOC119383242 [Rhipicephalus sanguineus]
MHQPWLAAFWLLPLVVAAASQSSAGDSKEQPKASSAATRSRRGAMEELQSQIRWEYGGWRPIMPGSPFFFVKTSRAVSLDGSASALTPVRMRAPQLHNSLHKDDSKEDLKAEASSASERMAESQSIARHVPMGAPPVGSGAGCCDFQPVLYVKHQSNSYQQAKGSSPAWQATKPENNLAGDDDEDYQKDAGKPEGDLKSSGSQIVHGSPIGDERPQLPHQLLQDGQDAQASLSSPTGLESMLSKLPVSIHPVLQGQGEQIMSALSGLDGSIQPANIEQLLQHVHASGGVAPDVERLIAAMVNSAHGGQGHGHGLPGPEVHQGGSVPGLPPGVPLAHPGPGGQYGENPTAPPYHPRPDKNIFRWYPKPRATAPPPHKPTYTEMPRKPGEMNSKQQNSQGKSYGGGGFNEQILVQNALHAMQNVQHQMMGATPVHLAVVQGPILAGNGVHHLPQQGPLQQLEAPPLAHHYGGLDGDVAHADSQQHFVTARPHDPPNFDRQAARRPPQQLPPPPPPPPPQHLQQRPPPPKPEQHQQHQQLQQHHQEYQPQHHQQPQQHSVPYPGYQEHTISAEIVRGRPQGDYDPRQPPRIHVEDVPADVLATGIHPNGHPIRVDGINLNIITPSQNEPPPFPPRHPQTTASPSPAPVFTHYHRPEDVASAPFFQHQHHQDASHDSHQHHNYNATADATGNKEHYYDQPSYHHDDRKQDNQSYGDPVYHESQKEGHYQDKAQEEDSREPSKEDGGHTSDSETEEVDYDQYTDEITETPAPDSKRTSEAPPQEQKEKTTQRGAIHFHPIQTATVQKEEDKAQLYHAYYAPAQHKPPPGYVRMTVEEFNRLFKDAEIQFIGSESDLNKKLSGKASQSKVQYSQTEDKDSQTSTVKIETVGSQAEEKKVAIKTSVSVSTSTSTGNKGAYHSFIQPRENAGRAASDSPLANLQATTRKTFKTTTSKPSTPENKDNSPANLFGARIKMPRSQKSQS